MSNLKICRMALAFAWIYHGLVPKVFYLAPGEIALLNSSPIPPDLIPFVVRATGLLEIAFGVILYRYYRQKKLLYLNIFLLIFLLISAGIALPSVLVQAFNPVSMNVLLIALSFIQLNLLSAEKAED